MGISISVPENSLSHTDDDVNLHIQSCFSGPFELPSTYDSASPAFLIHLSRRVDFQKDVTVKIRHHVSLQSEEDCEDMVFLSASSTPENRESQPVYTFKTICGTKTVFRPGRQMGKIALRHFCLIKAGKRKRSSSKTTSKKHKGTTLCPSSIIYYIIHSIQIINRIFIQYDCIKIYDIMVQFTCLCSVCVCFFQHILR